jgi:membrane protease YdiL (CAAX protease family)
MRKSSPWFFLALAVGLSWLFWVPAALWGEPEPAPLTRLLHYVGGLMPLLVAIALVYTTLGREGRRDYWRRAIDFKRIGTQWYAVILLLVPALTGLGILLDLLLGGHGAQLEVRFVGRPLAILPFAIFALLFGPLPEEMAWRGYGLDRLQESWNALTSSLVLGLVWALWHLPLFFIAGSYQNSLMGSSFVWLFPVQVVALSVVVTWIYNHNQRSTLSAVLLHFMVNFTGELFMLTARAEVCYTVFWVMAAVLVTLLWGPKTLTREGNRTHSDGVRFKTFA